MSRQMNAGWSRCQAPPQYNRSARSPTYSTVLQKKKISLFILHSYDDRHLSNCVTQSPADWPNSSAPHRTMPTSVAGFRGNSIDGIPCTYFELVRWAMHVRCSVSNAIRSEMRAACVSLVEWQLAGAGLLAIPLRRRSEPWLWSNPFIQDIRNVGIGQVSDQSTLISAKSSTSQLGGRSARIRPINSSNFTTLFAFKAMWSWSIFGNLSFYH